jgi:predicted phage gp36 major capsid-like protein
MTKEDRERAEARFNKAARASQEAKTGKTDRDASTKAVLDNMAKLKALRLAREAAEPPRSAPAAKKAPRAKPGSKSADKKVAPALSDWLAGQQSGGRRT